MTVHFKDVYTVDEAAGRLGIAPRRLTQLLVSGVIAGERHGRSWLVSGEALSQSAVQPPAVGRPFGERLAWSVLAAIEGRPPNPDLAREERARARRHLERPLAELLPRLRGRAAVRRLILGASALEGLVTSGRFVVGGARALRLIGSTRSAALDLYLPAGDYEHFLDETLAVPDPAYANLVVHLISAKNWPFGSSDGGVAWSGAALLDLYEAGTIEGAALVEALQGISRRSTAIAGSSSRQEAPSSRAAAS